LTTPGLVDAIGRPELALADVVRHYQPYNLAVLPAGAQPPLPDEVVASPRLGMLLEEARRQYDYIVVDTPPLVGALEGRVISRWVDGFLLVVAAHRTPRRLLEDALNLMDEAKTIGLVFNQADDVPVAYR
jgi:Mrp family chromosome partitioning ATPase